jgi:hypothetical protein
MQRIIRDVDPNYFNSRLQGYEIHNAQIEYLEGYHLVSNASTYELLPHPRYQNSYNYNAQQLQVQGSQAQIQGQPRQQIAGMNADDLVNRITAMIQSQFGLKPKGQVGSY